MAELTELDEKLAEVYGLAQAAQGATTKVAGLVDDERIKSLLERMRDEAVQTEERCEPARRRAPTARRPRSRRRRARPSRKPSR